MYGVDEYDEYDMNTDDYEDEMDSELALEAFHNLR